MGSCVAARVSLCKIFPVELTEAAGQDPCLHAPLGANVPDTVHLDVPVHPLGLADGFLPALSPWMLPSTRLLSSAAVERIVPPGGVWALSTV